MRHVSRQYHYNTFHAHYRECILRGTTSANIQEINFHLNNTLLFGSSTKWNKVYEPDEEEPSWWPLGVMSERTRGALSWWLMLWSLKVLMNSTDKHPDVFVCPGLYNCKQDGTAWNLFCQYNACQSYFWFYANWTLTVTILDHRLVSTYDISSH